MALKSTIFRAELAVSDIDRGYYATHQLTIARHPSETDERMMVRVLAFAVRAHELLEFGKGIASDDEPALWQKDYTGAIQEWIDVGLPEERLIRRACGRAAQVFVFPYGGRATDMWWKQNGEALAKQTNLTVLEVPFETSRELAKLAARNMALTATIHEGQIFLADGERSIEVPLRSLMAAA